MVENQNGEIDVIVIIRILGCSVIGMGEGENEVNIETLCIENVQKCMQTAHTFTWISAV